MYYQPAVVLLLTLWCVQGHVCSDIDTRLRTQSFDSVVSLSVTKLKEKKRKLNSITSEYIIELALVFPRYRIGYRMAQPAGFAAQDNRTDMGIPVFWASANLDPPWQFKIWFEQFLMAVTVKENVNPEVILEEPKKKLEEPSPRPKTPREGETETATIARNLRDKLARDRVMLENEERRTRGPRVGHNVFYNELQKKLGSRLFLSLGTEGKKRFLQKNPHVEISKMLFREITELAEVSFQKVKCVTMKDINCSHECKNPENHWRHFMQR